MRRFVTPISDQRRPGPAKPAAHQGDECAPAEGLQFRAFALAAVKGRGLRPRVVELVAVEGFHFDPIRRRMLAGVWRLADGSFARMEIALSEVTVVPPGAPRPVVQELLRDPGVARPRSRCSEESGLAWALVGLMLAFQAILALSAAGVWA